MKSADVNRRKFLKYSAATATGAALLSSFPKDVFASDKFLGNETTSEKKFYRLYPDQARIRFSIIGINHDHIYAQVNAVINGGGPFGISLCKRNLILLPHS